MTALQKLEHWVVAVLRGERRGLVACAAWSFLRFAGVVYCSVVTIRNWAYDWGLLPHRCANIPVISVGNIVAGGTGKTPLTLLLASALVKSKKVAILSRGYRSPAERRAIPTLVSSKGTIHVSSAVCGDEPYLLAKNVPEATVVAGRDRVKSVEVAMGQGVEIIILDDGFQHRRLYRNTDIVVVNAADIFGGGYCLPAGFLREPPKGFRRADLIVVNNIGGVDTEGYRSICRSIRKYTNAPIVSADRVVEGVYSADGDKIASLKNTKLAVACGIADPSSFEKTVSQQLNGEIVGAFSWGDHLLPDEKALARFAADAAKKGAEWILCTEKDWVRFESPPSLPVPWGWVKMGLTIVDGKEEWSAFIEEIISLNPS